MTLSNYFLDFEQVEFNQSREKWNQIGSIPHTPVHEWGGFLLNSPLVSQAFELRIPAATNNNTNQRKFCRASKLSFSKRELKCFLTPRRASSLFSSL